MKTTLTSPGFPRFYSNSMNCLTLIVASAGYRILIEFEELVLENEPQCTYDYLEMFEPNEKSTNANRTTRHNQSLLKVHTQQQLEQQDLQKMLWDDIVQQPIQLRNIFQPSNAVFNIFRPPPGTSDRMPRVICGDWSSKLKLLRFQTSSNLLGVRFSSDYSHNFSGFKAKISMEKGRFS